MRINSSRIGFPLVATLALASSLACSKTSKAPTPLAATALPSGAALKPWDASKQTKARPQGMVALGDKVWVAVTNLKLGPYGYTDPGGPGMLVGVVPSTGAQTIIDLGGADEHGCSNSGYVRTDGSKLFASCTGTYDTTDASGKAIVEADPATGLVTRRVATPAGFVPSGLAAATGKIWVGDSTSARLFSVDRATFAIADGANADHPAITLPCSDGSTFISDVAFIGGDIYALCSASAGYIVRLDAATGAVKGTPQLVGAIPVALTATGDGRIAVANSVSATLSLVTATATAMTVEKDLVTFDQSAALQDVRSRGNFLYVVASGTQSVIKVDLAAKGGPAKVAASPTGASSNPYNIVPLDDDQTVVSNLGTDSVVAANLAVLPPVTAK